MTRQSQASLAKFVQTESQGAPHPDARLPARQDQIMARLVENPAAALPEAMVTDAELEACYRFLENPRVRPAAILAPHRAATAARARAEGRVVAVHDGTELDYSTHKTCEGLGHLRQGQRGYLAHLTLLTTDGRGYEPLGVPVVSTWVRKPGRRSKDPKTGRRRTGSDYAKVTDKESGIWRAHVEQAEAACGARVALTHVMDAGSDAYELLAWLQGCPRTFVLRCARDRVVLAPEEVEADASQRLSEALLEVPDRATRVVTVAARKARTAPRAARKAPPRKLRMARVHLAARRMILRRPNYLAEAPAELEVNVVVVRELAPPADQEPVAWVLLTNEPIATVADLRRVVDLYVARFQIEVYIDALKNGCLIERRRLNSYASLANMLALAVPVAWQLMRLRAIARQPQPRPATDVLSRTQLAVLRACGPLPLAAAPTAQEALRAVAKLGGNIGKRVPGWRVLARGLDALMRMQLGWKMARNTRKNVTN